VLLVLELVQLLVLLLAHLLELPRTAGATARTTD